MFGGSESASFEMDDFPTSEMDDFPSFEMDEDEATADRYWGSYCVNGLILPISRVDLSTGGRFGLGFLCLAALIYLFICIAFISETMMSRFRKMTFSWNKTVANFTLLSFGITAPQMMLTFYEQFSQGFNAGDMGPFSIIGSAAFRYLVIIGYCVFFCTFGRINNVLMFLVSSFICKSAFFCVHLFVGPISTAQIEIFEALLLMVPYPFIIVILYFLDIKCKRNGSNSSNEPIPLQEGKAGADVGGEDGAATSKEQGDNYEEQPKSFKIECNTNNRENTWKLIRLITMPWSFLFDLLSMLPNVVDQILSFLLAYFILMPIFIILVMDLASHLGCFLSLKAAGSGILLMTLGFCIPSAISARNAIKNGSTVDNIVAQMIGSNIMSVFLGLGLPWLILASYHHIAGVEGGFQIAPGSLTFNVQQLLVNAKIFTLIVVIGALVPLKLQDNKIWRIVWGILFALCWLIMVVLSFLEMYGIVQFDSTFLILLP